MGCSKIEKAFFGTPKIVKMNFGHPKNRAVFKIFGGFSRKVGTKIVYYSEQNFEVSSNYGHPKNTILGVFTIFRHPKNTIFDKKLGVFLAFLSILATFLFFCMLSILRIEKVTIVNQ